jgi:DNA-binding beta-propeller fold protein YncE
MFRVVSLLLLLLLTPLAARAASQVKFISEIPVEKPLRLAVDREGRFFVTGQNGNVVMTSTEGKILLSLQTKDSSDKTILKKPTGIALDRDTIYIADKSLDRVVMFSRDGSYLDSFGSSGSGPGELSNPRGIFVNQGVVYVADYSNDRIQVFGANGVYQGAIGDSGGESSLKSPTDVAVDPNGIIYAIDGSSNQVKMFKANGSYAGKLNGVINPKSLAVASDGIYVTDQENCSILKFAFSGERISSFGSMGDGRAQFQEVGGIVTDSQGNVCIADTRKGSVQVIATDKGRVVEAVDWAPPPTSVRWLRDSPIQSRRIFWDSQGERLFTIDEKTDTVQVVKGDQLEQTLKVPDWTPVAVKVVQGSAWVVDRSESRIIKFDAAGKQLFTFGGSGSKPGFLSKPRDIAVLRDGTVYVADTGNDRIQVFTNDGVFLNIIGAEAGIPELRNPTAVEVDDKGNLYILSSSASHILRVAPDGKVLKRIGENEGRGKLDEPVSLAIIGHELLVLDAGASNIKVYSLAGDFLRQFGAKGEGKGEFRKPASLTVVSDNRIMVADYGNKRVQLLGIVHTPAPPQELSATAGMRSVELAWKGTSEPFVTGYRVYRAKGKPGNYMEIATVKHLSFQDSNLEPLVLYFYRVSAVARDGNEAVAKDFARATPIKYRTVPPKGLAATSQEWSVDLRWEPNRETFTDRYLIYRKDDNDKGVFELVGETKGTTFTEGKLESDTPYVYAVSTMSSDGMESDRTILKVKTIVATKPPLQLDVIDISNIFSNTYKIYETEGIGKILLTNNTRTQIDSLKLSFAIKSYMDFPSEIEIRNLPPQSSREIPLKAVFNNRILEVSEDTPVQAEIMVTYYENQKPRSYSKNHTVTLYEKHRMMWVEKDRVATFVTSKDPVLLEFARSVVTQYGEVSSPLVYASAIFDYLGHMGMTYLLHPTNPYQITEGQAAYVDYVQYPRDTLKRNSGVCTDLVVLFSAALESLGVRTMFLGIPGHLFMMFALGPVSELGDDTLGDMFVIYDDLMWVPVELTTVGSPFMKAWEVGSRTFNENKDKGTIDFTDPRSAWERYKPATLPFTDWRVQVIARGEVDKHYNNEMARINKIALKYLSIGHYQTLKKDPNDVNAMMQIGIIYGEGGEFEEALRYFEKADALSPKNPTINNNLGNLHYLKGDYREALVDYQHAAELDPADPYILINLTKCYLRLEQREKAADAFRKAMTMDREISQKYRAIAIELLGSL